MKELLDAMAEHWFISAILVIFIYDWATNLLKALVMIAEALKDKNQKKKP